MIEIRITKEIGDYKPRVVGPFNMRQMVVIGCCAPLCFLIFKHLSPILTMEVAGLFCFIPASIAYLIGWYQPYGMPIERFLESVFVNRVLAPQHRKYVTVNSQELFLKIMSAEQGRAKRAEKAPKGRKRKDAQKETPNQPRKRYKVDPRAIK